MSVFNFKACNYYLAVTHNSTIWDLGTILSSLTDCDDILDKYSRFPVTLLVLDLAQTLSFICWVQLRLTMWNLNCWKSKNRKFHQSLIHQNSHGTEDKSIWFSQKRGLDVEKTLVLLINLQSDDYKNELEEPQPSSLSTSHRFLYRHVIRQEDTSQYVCDSRSSTSSLLFRESGISSRIIVICTDRHSLLTQVRQVWRTVETLSTHNGNILMRENQTWAQICPTASPLAPHSGKFFAWTATKTQRLRKSTVIFHSPTCCCVISMSNSGEY